MLMEAPLLLHRAYPLQWDLELQSPLVVHQEGFEEPG